MGPAFAGTTVKVAARLPSRMHFVHNAGTACSSESPHVPSSLSRLCRRLHCARAVARSDRHAPDRQRPASRHPRGADQHRSASRPASLIVIGIRRGRPDLADGDHGLLVRLGALCGRRLSGLARHQADPLAGRGHRRRRAAASAARRLLPAGLRGGCSRIRNCWCSSARSFRSSWT